MRNDDTQVLHKHFLFAQNTSQVKYYFNVIKSRYFFFELAELCPVSVVGIVD
jgi:hypothetical protein